MQLLRADSHLRAKAELSAVGEACGGIPVHGGRIYQTQETSGVGFFVGDGMEANGVTGAELAEVMTPWVGVISAAAALISVLLPAPLGPRIAVTRPGRRVALTSLSTRRPDRVTSTPWMVSSMPHDPSATASGRRARRSAPSPRRA